MSEGKSMIVEQTLDELRSYIQQLERNLAETDALIATHISSIDPSPRDKWPNGSLLEKSLHRHEERCLKEQLRKAEDERVGQHYNHMLADMRKRRDGRGQSSDNAL
jgi:hypothetical protein